MSHPRKRRPRQGRHARGARAHGRINDESATDAQARDQGSHGAQGLLPGVQLLLDIVDEHGVRHRRELGRVAEDHNGLRLREQAARAPIAREPIARCGFRPIVNGKIGRS